MKLQTLASLDKSIGAGLKQQIRNGAIPFT